MKYIKHHVIEWDETCQVEMSDDDFAQMKVPAGVEVQGEPWPNVPIRPRSRAEADEQRRKEMPA